MDLVGLLVIARMYNQNAGITGALVYGEGQFIQVIEGEEEAVRSLYDTIVRDPRHTSILKLADKPIAERTFSGWSMAFRELSPEQMVSLEGYITPAQWARTAVIIDSADGLLLKNMRDIVLMRGI
jgi:hypothetical protein